MRLALQRGGRAIDDPKAWWDSLPDDVVELWEAYWRVEPWGGEWERHAQQMSMLDATYAAHVNQYLSRSEAHRPNTPQWFMPPDYYKDPEAQPKTPDIGEQLDALVRKYK